MRFLLHVTFTTGTRQTLTFASADLRGYAMITLSSHPVDMQIEDVA